MMPSTLSKAHTQQGLTLVELLVALALSGLVILAGVAAMSFARQGFLSVDATSQLRDNARFASQIMRRIIVQAGFQDTDYAVSVGSDFKTADATEQPNVRGYNNKKYHQNLATGADPSPAAAGVNGSDLLVLRFQSGRAVEGGASDEAMIKCNGQKVTAPISSTDRTASIFHVAVSATTGEPTLMCSWQNDDGTWPTAEPLVDGVETLQILYGVDGVTPGAAPTTAADTVPDRYLRADQLNGPTEAATIANWKRVRSIRVGMVVRGPRGSAPELTVPAQYPLGPNNLMNSTNDVGSTLAQQSDGRLRQTVTFTIHLRNPQDNL